MWSWLRRLFAAPPAPPVEAPPPPVAQLPPPAEPPPPPPPPPQELVDTLEAVRKAARAQAKLALRVDELHELTTAQLAALREGVDKAAAKAAAPELPWPDLLDALDLLDHAADELAASDRDDVAQGLRRVAGRVGRFVEKGGYQRLGAVGEPVDPRRFRVVGTDDVPASQEGTIVRVLRAAVVQDGRIVREGEVISQRRRPQ